MNTPRVSREQAELLKKVGYDVPHVYVYNNRDRLVYLNYAEGNFDFDNSGNVSAPTLDEAARWLREVKGWHVQVDPDKTIDKEMIWSSAAFDMRHGYSGIARTVIRKGTHIHWFTTHDLALSAGIDLILKKLTDGTH